MSGILLGRPISAFRFLDRAVTAEFRDGRVSFGGYDVVPPPPPPPPPSGHYIHSLWGDTSKLTPPPALLGRPLVVTDIDRDKPKGGYVLNGLDGQVVRGRWKTTDSPSTSYDGRSAPAGEGPVPGGRVWDVHVDGKGADIWLDLASNPTRRDMDFHLQVENCRTFRLSGAEWVCDDVRKISGGWPDNGGWLNQSSGGGHEQWIKLTKHGNNATIFVEGCYLDLNNGGLVPSYRTDIFSSAHIGSNNNNNSVCIFQNCVFWNASSSLTNPPSHADIFHMQGNSYWRYVIAENLRTRSNYQGFQNHYPTARPAVATNETHFRWYRCRLWSADSGGSKPQAIASFGADGKFTRYASFEMDDVAISRNGAIIYRDVLKQDLSQAAGYDNARRNIDRYADYGDGKQQPTMTFTRNVRRVSQTNDPNSDGVVPLSAIGHNFAHLWGPDGSLLAER